MPEASPFVSDPEIVKAIVTTMTYNRERLVAIALCFSFASTFRWCDDGMSTHSQKILIFQCIAFENQLQITTLRSRNK
jgi:hypothetical protein